MTIDDMYIKEISLTQFRNYQELSLQFHKKLNIITGQNAQGKTNLLESIYIMSMGKSFRTSRDSEMIGFGQESCKARAVAARCDRDVEIEITYRPEGKLVKIDGLRAPKTSDLLEKVYAVAFSPEDLKIVKDEPEKRRRFLDRELCQIRPVYYKNLGRYKRILQNRNALLRDGGSDEKLLSVYNQELANYGARILLDRAAFVKKLNRISRDIHEKITDGKESLQISYESNLSIYDEWETQASHFLDRLNQTQEQDRWKKNTRIGPHRDDLNIEVNGVDLRHYGSQGQQRTAALSLKLAEIYLIREETGEDAVLLLDDVLSELDVQRQTFLLSRLKEIQIFITTTELSQTLLGNLKEGFVFQVKNGEVHLWKTLENPLT